MMNRSVRGHRNSPKLANTAAAKAAAANAASAQAAAAPRQVPCKGSSLLTAAKGAAKAAGSKSCSSCSSSKGSSSKSSCSNGTSNSMRDGTTIIQNAIVAQSLTSGLTSLKTRF